MRRSLALVLSVLTAFPPSLWAQQAPAPAAPAKPEYQVDRENLLQTLQLKSWELAELAKKRLPVLEKLRAVEYLVTLGAYDHCASPLPKAASEYDAREVLTILGTFQNAVSAYVDKYGALSAPAKTYGPIGLRPLPAVRAENGATCAPTVPSSKPVADGQAQTPGIAAAAGAVDQSLAPLALTLDNFTGRPLSDEEGRLLVAWTMTFRRFAVTIAETIAAEKGEKPSPVPNFVVSAANGAKLRTGFLVSKEAKPEAAAGALMGGAKAEEDSAATQFTPCNVDTEENGEKKTVAKTCITPGARVPRIDAMESLALSIQPEVATLGTHLDALRKLSIETLVGQYAITNQLLNDSRTPLPNACRTPDLEPFDKIYRYFVASHEAELWSTRLQGIVAGYVQQLRAGTTSLPATLATAPFVAVADTIASEWLTAHVSKKLKAPKGTDPADAPVKEQIRRVQTELGTVSFGQRLPTNGGRVTDAFGLSDIFAVKLMNALQTAVADLAKSDTAKRPALLEGVVRTTLERVLVETLAAHGLAVGRDEGLNESALDRLWQTDFRHRWMATLHEEKNSKILDQAAKDISAQFSSYGQWAEPVDLAKAADEKLEGYTAEQMERILEAQRAEDTARYMRNLIAEKNPNVMEVPTKPIQDTATLGIGSYEWRLAGGFQGASVFNGDSPRFFQLNDRNGHGYGYTLTLPDTSTTDGYSSVSAGLISLVARLQEKLVKRLKEKGFTDEKVRKLFPEITSTTVLANLLIARFNKALKGDAKKTATLAGENKREQLRPLVEWLISYNAPKEYRAAATATASKAFNERLGGLFSPELAGKRDAAWKAELERQLRSIRSVMGVSAAGDAENTVLKNAADKLAVAVADRQKFADLVPSLKRLRDDAMDSGKLEDNRWLTYCKADRKACRQWAESIVAPFNDEPTRRLLYDRRLGAATKNVIAQFLAIYGAGKPQYGVAKLDANQQSVVTTLESTLVALLQGRLAGAVLPANPLVAKVDAVFKTASAAAHRARPLAPEIIAQNATAEMAALGNAERGNWEKKLADALAEAMKNIDGGDDAALNKAKDTLRTVANGENFVLTFTYLTGVELSTPVGQVLGEALFPPFEEFSDKVMPLLRRFLAHGSDPSEELETVQKDIRKARALLEALRIEKKHKEVREAEDNMKRAEVIEARLKERVDAERDLEKLLRGILEPLPFVQSAVSQAFQRSSQEAALFVQYARDQHLRAKKDPRGEKELKLSAEEAIADLNELATGLVRLYPVEGPEVKRFLDSLKKYLEAAGIPENAPRFAKALEDWLAPSAFFATKPTTISIYGASIPLPFSREQSAVDALKKRWEALATFAALKTDVFAPILEGALKGATREATLEDLKKAGLDAERIRKAALTRVEAVETVANEDLAKVDALYLRFAADLPVWREATLRPEAAWRPESVRHLQPTSAIGGVLEQAQEFAKDIGRETTLAKRSTVANGLESVLARAEELSRAGVVPRSLVRTFQRLVQWRKTFLAAKFEFDKGRQKWLGDYWNLADATGAVRFAGGPLSQPLLGKDNKAVEVKAPRTEPAQQIVDVSYDDFQVLQHVAALLTAPIPGLKPHLERFATEAKLRELPSAADAGRSLTPAERRSFYIAAEGALMKEIKDKGDLSALKIFGEGAESALSYEQFQKRMTGLFGLWLQMEEKVRGEVGGPKPEVANGFAPGSIEVVGEKPFKNLARTIVRNFLAYLPVRIRGNEILFPSTQGTVEDSLKAFDAANESLRRQWVVWLAERWRNNLRYEPPFRVVPAARAFSRHFLDKAAGPIPTPAEKDWAFVAENFASAAGAVADPGLLAWKRDVAKFGRREALANVFTVQLEPNRETGQAESFAYWLSSVASSPQVAARWAALKDGLVKMEKLRRLMAKKTGPDGEIIDPRQIFGAAIGFGVAAIPDGNRVGRKRLWEHYATLADFLKEEGPALQARMEVLDQVCRNSFKPETFPYVLSLLHWDINVYGRRGEWNLSPDSGLIATAPREATMSMLMGEILDLTGLRLDDTFAWKRVLENHEIAAPEDWLEIAQQRRGLLAGYKQQRFLGTRVEATYVKSPVPLGVNYNYRPLPIVDPSQRSGLAPDMTVEEYLARIDSDRSYELARTGVADEPTVTLFEQNAAMFSQMAGENDLTAGRVLDNVARRGGKWTKADFLGPEVPAERFTRIRERLKTYGVNEIADEKLKSLVSVRGALVNFQKFASEMLERLPSEDGDYKVFQGRGNPARIPFSGVSGELNAMLKAFAEAIGYTGKVEEISLGGRFSFKDARLAIGKAVYYASAMAREVSFKGAEPAEIRNRELALLATDGVYTILQQKKGIRFGIETVRTNVKNQLGRLCSASWVKDVKTEDEYKAKHKELEKALGENGESQLLQFDDVQKFLYEDSGWIPKGTAAEAMRVKLQRLGALKRWSEEQEELWKKRMMFAIGVAVLVFVQGKTSPGAMRWIASKTAGRVALALVPVITSGTFVVYQGFETYETFWGKPEAHATRVGARDTHFQGNRTLMSDETAMQLEQAGRDVLAGERNGWGWLWRALGFVAAIHTVQALNEVRVVMGLRLNGLAAADSLEPAIARMSKLRELLGFAKEDAVLPRLQGMSREEVERRIIDALAREMNAKGVDGRLVLEDGPELRALRADAKKSYELACQNAKIHPYTHEPIAAEPVVVSGDPIARALLRAEQAGQRLDAAAQGSQAAHARMLYALMLRLENSRVSLDLPDLALLLGSQKADPVLRHLPAWLEIFGVRGAAGWFSRDVQMLRRFQKIAHAAVDVMMFKDPQTLLQLVNLSRLEGVSAYGVRFADLYNPKRVDQLLNVPAEQKKALEKVLDRLLKEADQYVRINARNWVNAAEVEEARMMFLRKNFLASVDSSVVATEGAEALVASNRLALEGVLRDVAPATRRYFVEVVLHQRGLGMHPQARDIINTLHRLGQWHARFGPAIRDAAAREGLTEEEVITRMLRNPPKEAEAVPVTDSGGVAAVGVELPTVGKASQELHAIFAGPGQHHAGYFDLRLIKAIALEEYDVLALRFMQMRPFVPRAPDVPFGRVTGNNRPTVEGPGELGVAELRARLLQDHPTISLGSNPLTEMSSLQRSPFFANGAEEESVLKILLERKADCPDAKALREWIGKKLAQGELSGEALQLHRKAARTLEVLQDAQREIPANRDGFVRRAVEFWRTADAGGPIPMSATEAQAMLVAERPAFAEALAKVESQLPSLEAAKHALFRERLSLDEAAAELEAPLSSLRTAEAIEARVRTMSTGASPGKLQRIDDAANSLLEAVARENVGSLPSETMVDWAVARVRASRVGAEVKYHELASEWMTAEKQTLGFAETGPRLPSRGQIEARFRELSAARDADVTALTTARDRLLEHRQKWDNYFLELDRAMTTRGGEPAKQVNDALETIAHVRYKATHGGMPSADFVARMRTRIATRSDAASYEPALKRLEDGLNGRLGVVDDADIVRRAAALRGRADATTVNEAEALLRRVASHSAGSEDPAAIAEALEVQRWMITDPTFVRRLPTLRPGPLADRTALLFRATGPTSVQEARLVANWRGALEPKSIVEGHIGQTSDRLRALADRADGAEKAGLEQALKNLDGAKRLLLPE